MAKNLPHLVYDVTHKNLKPETKKIFFIEDLGFEQLSLKTEGFEQLSLKT